MIVELVGSVRANCTRNVLFKNPVLLPQQFTSVPDIDAGADLNLWCRRPRSKAVGAVAPAMLVPCSGSFCIAPWCLLVC